MNKERYLCDYTETVTFPARVKSYPAYYYLDPRKFEFPEEENLILFPNPSADYVIAYYNSLNFGETGSITINNILGQRISKKSLNSEQNQLIIDLSHMPNGIYFVSLIINNELIESEKLIKGRF